MEGGKSSGKHYLSPSIPPWLAGWPTFLGFLDLVHAAHVEAVEVLCGHPLDIMAVPHSKITHLWPIFNSQIFTHIMYMYMYIHVVVDNGM